MTESNSFLDKARAFIRNPLGIIGLFIVMLDGLAAGVLGASPYLSDDQRWLLVIFTVLFPFVVLGVFYRLVTKHHPKLYAPADWKDEKNFFRSQSHDDIARLSAVEAVDLELAPHRSELLEGLSPNRGELRPDPSKTRPSELTRMEEAFRRGRQAEELAIRAIEEEMGGVSVQRRVFLEGKSGDIAFDGLAVNRRKQASVAIEVKALNSFAAVHRAIDSFVHTASLADTSMKAVQSPFQLSFILALVATTDELDIAKLYDLAVRRVSEAPLGVNVRVFSLRDLIKRYPEHPVPTN